MLISKGVQEIQPANLRFQLEEKFMADLKRDFENEGWFVWRINDVRGTGMRVSDLFVNVHGVVHYVETKISSKPLEALLCSPQSAFATAGQIIHNNTVQKNNSGFFYVIRSIKCSEPLTLVYTSDILKVEGNALPTIAMTIPELKQYFIQMGSHLPNYKQTLEGLIK